MKLSMPPPLQHRLLTVSVDNTINVEDYQDVIDIQVSHSYRLRVKLKQFKALPANQTRLLTCLCNDVSADWSN